MQVTLTKTAEKCVKFARFCRDHNVNPQLVAEVIELLKLYNRPLGARALSKRSEIRGHIQICMNQMGLTNFELDGTFGNARVLFRDPNTDETDLIPEI